MSTHHIPSSAMPGWLANPSVPQISDPVGAAHPVPPVRDSSALGEIETKEIDPPADKKTGEAEEKQQPLFAGVTEKRHATDEREHVGKRRKKREPTPPF